MPLIRQILAGDREIIQEHLLKLSPDDRFLRFSQTTSDELIIKYCQNIDFSRSEILAIENINGEIVGISETLIAPGGGAEIAFSVLKEAQGAGLGEALFERTVRHAKTRGIKHLSLICMSNNKAMRKIAEKHGMELEGDFNQVEGYMNVAEATPSDITNEIIDDTMAEISHYHLNTIKNTSALLSLLNPWNILFKEKECNKKFKI